MINSTLQDPLARGFLLVSRGYHLLGPDRRGFVCIPGPWVHVVSGRSTMGCPWERTLGRAETRWQPGCRGTRCYWSVCRHTGSSCTAQGGWRHSQTGTWSDSGRSRNQKERCYFEKHLRSWLREQISEPLFYIWNKLSTYMPKHTLSFGLLEVHTLKLMENSVVIIIFKDSPTHIQKRTSFHPSLLTNSGQVPNGLVLGVWREMCVIANSNLLWQIKYISWGYEESTIEQWPNVSSNKFFQIQMINSFRTDSWEYRINFFFESHSLFMERIFYIWRAYFQKGLDPISWLLRKNAFLCASLYTRLWKTQYWIYNIFFLLVTFGSEMRFKGKG